MQANRSTAHNMQGPFNAFAFRHHVNSYLFSIDLPAPRSPHLVFSPMQHAFPNARPKSDPSYPAQISTTLHQAANQEQSSRTCVVSIVFEFVEDLGVPVFEQYTGPWVVLKHQTRACTDEQFPWLSQYALHCSCLAGEELQEASEFWVTIDQLPLCLDVPIWLGSSASLGS